MKCERFIATINIAFYVCVYANQKYILPSERPSSRVRNVQCWTVNGVVALNALSIIIVTTIIIHY